MSYRSIFLAPDWQHVRYLGWRDGWPGPALRVMTRRQGPFRRVLAVSEIADPERLARHWGAVGAVSPLAEVRFHDLTGSPEIAGWLEARGLKELPASERMLNVGTFAIDLSQPEDALLAAMGSDTRRKLRKGEEAGLRFVADPALLPAFLDAFNTMAEERALQRLDAALAARMIAGGHARLFTVTDADGAPQTFLLSYEAGGTGFFASGAARGRPADGAGQLLHWGAMRAFRDAGLGWYDMGGIASTDPSDGIHRFKKGFGGAFVDLGREYGRSGALVRAARALRR